MRKHYERILHDSESRVQRYLDIQILDENSPFCGGFPKADSLAEPKTAIYRATTMTACCLPLPAITRCCSSAWRWRWVLPPY